MSDFFENFDFSRDALHVLLVVNFVFLQYFYCDLKRKELIKPIVGTFSPVSTCVPCLTCPNVPLPSALPTPDEKDKFSYPGRSGRS